MNIYELTSSYIQLQDMIEDGESDNEVLLDTLQSIEGALEEKVDNIIYIIKNKEARVTALRVEEKSLADKRRAEENAVKRLKELIEMYLLATGNKRVDTDRFTARIQKNAPSLEVVDETAIPKEWFNVPEPVPTLDKRGLLKHIRETGEVVEGVTIKQTESIRIK